ncbi:MAG: chemotaxis-specific protein-glutamate methyltransferase CheB, partial [Bacteroidota bacterium]
MRKIRLLIVDDSTFIRKTLHKILDTDEIEVIDIAVNGREAVEKVNRLKPDIVTMDVEMPVMNGIEALKEIMITYPLPVLMLSTLTNEGAEVTLEALSEGAIDFVTKKAAFTELYGLKDELITKIKNIGRSSSIKIQMINRRRNLRIAAKKKFKDSKDDSLITDRLRAKIKQDTKKAEPAISSLRPHPESIDIITIGISTGGPAALQQLIPALSPKLNVPVLIAQHMPPYFTKTLSKRLDQMSQLAVKEAESGEPALPGTIYIAPGGKQMSVGPNSKINISDTPEDELYKPSVNVLFNSVASSFGSRAIGMIMTGMGHDGGDGCKALSD